MVSVIILVACVVASMASVARADAQLHSSQVKPRRFFVKPRQLPAIATAAFNMVGRLGSGAFVDGYNVGLKRSTPEKEAEYAVLSNVAGFRVEETTNRVFDKRPSKFMIEMYEFEGCPYCKKVREAVSILDVDVIFYPCPKGSLKHRDMVMEMGGKEQFPYMRDPNRCAQQASGQSVLFSHHPTPSLLCSHASGVAMYESDDIIAYLFDTYVALLGCIYTRMPTGSRPGTPTIPALITQRLAGTGRRSPRSRGV